MPAGERYRFHGKFVSDFKAHRLLNLKNVAQYVTSAPVAVTHYRYKGQFVSAGKAERIAHLPQASKYLSIEKEGERPVEAQVIEAIRRDREAQAERLREKREAREREREKERKAARHDEESRVLDIAREAARQAEFEGISIEEALDEQGFDEDDFQYFDYDAAEDFATDFMDFGDEADFFEQYDLEEEDHYPGE